MAVFLFYTVQDGKGQKSTTRIPFDDATDLLENATAVATAFAGVINPLLNGGLASAGVTAEIDLSAGWGPTALLVSDVQEKAEFAWRTVGGFIKRMNLPTFIEDFFNVGASTVDLSDPDVVAFVNAMEDGLTVGGTLYQPTDDREEDLVSLEYATENWGKRRG